MLRHNGSACVEVAPADGQIAVRDSMDPDGSRLQYPVQSWQSFVATIKNERIFGK
jgi:Domain of unknown function (DUF397)